MIQRGLLSFFLFIVIISLSQARAVSYSIESFETFPVGSYLENESSLFVPKFWFPALADDPLFEIVENDANNPVNHGNHSLKVHMDGRGDDGSIWLLAKIKVSEIGISASDHVLTIKGHVWSHMESFVNNWPIIASIAAIEPTSNETKQEVDFTIIGYTEQVAGWKEYRLTKNNFILPSSSDAIIYFAFGISVTWETERTYWIDDLSIEVDGSIITFPSSSDSTTQPVSSPIISVIFSLIPFIILKRRKE